MCDTNVYSLGSVSVIGNTKQQFASSPSLLSKGYQYEK